MTPSTSVTVRLSENHIEWLRTNGRSLTRPWIGRSVKRVTGMLRKSYNGYRWIPKMTGVTSTLS